MINVAQAIHSRASFVGNAQREAKYAREDFEYRQVLGQYNTALASCDIAQWRAEIPADHPAMPALRDLEGTLRILEADIHNTTPRTAVAGYARCITPEKLLEIEQLFQVGE